MHESVLLGQLKDQGFRITVARAALIHAFCGSDKPFSAYDLFNELKRQKLRTNLVTVYRELAFFEKLGFVHDVTFNDGVKRYELSSADHHHHLICTSCKKIQDIEMHGDLHHLEKKIRKETSFTVLNHSLEFYGLCSRCA